MSTGVLARAALISSIYRRGVMLTPKARTSLSNAALVNHISTDVSRIDACSQWFVSSFDSPSIMDMSDDLCSTLAHLLDPGRNGLLKGHMSLAVSRRVLAVLAIVVAPASNPSSPFSTCRGALMMGFDCVIALSLVVADRGPFIRGRIVDVSTQAANILGFRHAGVVPVRVETF